MKLKKYRISFNDMLGGKYGIPRIWDAEAKTAKKAKKQVLDKYPHAVIVITECLDNDSNQK